MKNAIFYTVYKILLRVLHQEGWSRHVACMREMRTGYQILVGKLDWRKHLEDRGVDGRKILKRILENIF
jgi:hypothetical protein